LVVEPAVHTKLALSTIAVNRARDSTEISIECARDSIEISLERTCSSFALGHVHVHVRISKKLVITPEIWTIFRSLGIRVMEHPLKSTHSMRVKLKPMQTRSGRTVEMKGLKIKAAASNKKQQKKRHGVRPQANKQPPRPFKKASLYYKYVGLKGKTTIKKVDTFYEVEQVLDARMAADGTAQYLVKWTGYHARENMWINELPIFFKRDCLLLLHKALVRQDQDIDVVYESSEDSDSSDSESESDTESDSESESDDDEEWM
jgi:hypothetical protein